MWPSTHKSGIWRRLSTERARARARASERASERARVHIIIHVNTRHTYVYPQELALMMLALMMDTNAYTHTHTHTHTVCIAHPVVAQTDRLTKALAHVAGTCSLRRRAPDELLPYSHGRAVQGNGARAFGTPAAWGAVGLVRAPPRGPATCATHGWVSGRLGADGGRGAWCRLSSVGGVRSRASVQHSVSIYASVVSEMKSLRHRAAATNTRHRTTTLEQGHARTRRCPARAARAPVHFRACPHPIFAQCLEWCGACVHELKVGIMGRRGPRARPITPAFAGQQRTLCWPPIV